MARRPPETAPADAGDESTPARTRVPAAERRLMILAAARRAFAEHGFHGASTASIARDAGCSEAVLYRHFPSKKALLVAVLEREVEGRLGDDRGLAPPRADPEMSFPEVLAARLAEDEMIVTVRLVLLALSMSHEPEVAEAVLKAFAGVRAPLRQALAAAQRRGELRDDIDAEQLTWMFQGLFLAGAVRRMVRDDEVAQGGIEAMRALVRLLEPPETG